MKKIFSATSPVSFVQRSLNFVLPQTCTSLNQLRLAQYATNGPHNMIFEKGDLNVSEVEAPEKMKKKDSTARPMDKTLQLNVNIDWHTSDVNDCSIIDEKSSTIRQLPQQRIINFKMNPKELIKNYPAAGQILEAAKNSGFPKPALYSIIYNNPKISEFNPEHVSSNLSQLVKLGFNVNEVVSIVRRYPDLLEYEGYDIFQTIEAWRTTSLSERFLINLFTKHPLLFSIPNDEAVRRVNRIRYLMMHKINRIMSIIERNPLIMDGDWARVEENFEYFYKTMRVSERDISRSKGLSLPLNFIKLRHTFLEKCGEYIRPKLKEEKGINNRKNPSLSSILDTSDEVFAVNVAKVSLDEYLIFKALMKYESAQPLECIFSDTY